MDFSKNRNYQSQEEENFIRRKKKAKRDLVLILVFLVLITGIMIIWLVCFSEALQQDNRPKLVEITAEKAGTPARNEAMFSPGIGFTIRITAGAICFHDYPEMAHGF